ncbi:MAG: LytR/AlgR family response regulator transcription factor [Candidatus Gastranaerophilaceae bacterium]
MKVLICDDDKYIVEEIKNNLNTFTDKHKIAFDIDSFYSGINPLNSNNRYDMAFIDIEMPQVNGLTLSAQLKKVNSNIIIFIITSHESYLDDAMDLDVFRYLSKPIDKDRFFRALNTAINYFHSNTQIITLEYYDECYSVFTSDIVYVTIENRKAVIITRQKKYYTNQKLSYWKEKLKGYAYFAQPHYSYLVNLRYVSGFNKTQLNIKMDLKNEMLPISQRYYSNFKKAYFAYIGV